MPSLSDFQNAVSGGAAELGSPGLADAMRPVAEAANMFAAHIKRLVGPFTQLTDIASHFVSSLDPSLIDDLNRKFRDLNAVIGVALRPIVDVAREVVKQLSDRLLPVMRQLQPIVEQISDAVGGALKQGLDDFGNFMKSIMPTLKIFKDIAVGLIKILQDVSVIFIAAGKAIMSLVGDALGGLAGEGKTVADVMKELRESVREVIKNLLVFAARLMMSFGFTKGVDALIKGLDRKAAAKEDTGGFAVATNAAFKSIGDLSKNAILEAFRASSMQGKAKNPAEETNELLGKLKTELEAIRQGPPEDSPMVTNVKETLTFLREHVKPHIVTVSEWFKNVDKEKAKKWIDDAQKFIDETLQGLRANKNGIEQRAGNIQSPLGYLKAKITGDLTPGQRAAAPDTFKG